MNKLERLDDLRSRAEEALRRSISGVQREDGKRRSDLATRLTASQIELLLENETMRIRKDRAEAELEHYKKLFAKAPVAYLIFDRKGKVVLFNEEAGRFLASEEKNTESLSVYQIAAHPSLNDLHELVAKTFRSNREQSGNMELSAGNMQHGHYKVSLSPFNDDATRKKLCRMVISGFPDQETYYRKELHKKEKDYHELMSNISEGIFYADKGVLYSVNPSLSHMLGYTEKQLKGRPLWELVGDTHEQMVRDLFRPHPAEDIKLPCDVKFVRSDGTVFWADLKVKHLRPGNTSIGTLSDITQRKLSENQLKDSERQLRQSNAAKDKLFSIISHDLRTPFSTLMGYIYLLMKEYGQFDESKRVTMIKSLYDITKQTYNMLENILVWSRSQKGGFPFAPRAFNLSTLMKENIRLYAPTAKAKGISLNSADMPEVMVFADPDMIQTVIRNLITNAIKFTPEKGRVILGLLCDEDEKITAYVKDSGIGIHPENMDQLFHIDSNFSTRGTNGEKGTGLGLTVCREFVEKNGGEIWVESSPGKGSTFCFTVYRKVDKVL